MWLTAVIEVGSHVEQDEEIATIETDKVHDRVHLTFLTLTSA